MVASFSDSESDDEEEGDETTNFVAIVATIGHCGESSESMTPLFEQPTYDSSDTDDEELTQETLAETYKELY
ncbi:unnamed protein product [Rhodiola kirilowii]